MNLSELIATRMKEVATARKDLLRKTRTSEDLAAPGNALKSRVARIDARIKRLEAQKADTIKRLDAAIAEERELKKRIEKEASQWAERTGTKTRRTTGTREKIVRKKTAPASTGRKPRTKAKK